MERYGKKEMIQTVETLIRANRAIGRAIKTDPGGVMKALTECQESAILLGTYIETFDGKYGYLVRILEDYCETVYQMSEGLSDEGLCKRLSAKIKKQLMEVNHGIRYDLPEGRREVVFLPYKASMWDSLESVWRAADEDENTDVYVIPIPYYDKNPDGSFREEHYEGNDYPDYVPVTRYDQYDFEGRKPDMIFIHNPYDECNYITSVHPFFYSGNLKRFTEKLVYIPYFVLSEIKADNQKAIEGIRHLCTVPAVFHADKVIVQSEEMRRVYIDVLLKETGDGSTSARKLWGGTIMGLGSPKIDKAVNTKREALEIPEEWMKIIRKPDGSFKKIIFYNTTITALLKSEGQMLRKMEHVFRIFKEAGEETALLWRPHPLIESTLISMRPQLWEQYKTLRDRYVSGGWGIYDTTAELNRAVALCDAYYGDLSSVVLLIQQTGKPVLLQNPDI